MLWELRVGIETIEGVEGALSPIHTENFVFYILVYMSSFPDVTVS